MDPIQLFAAASAREPLEQLASTFRTQTGIPVALNLGPSSSLARQLEQGASVDLFLSADESWADYVAQKGLVTQRQDLLTNRLVVVVPAEGAPRLYTLRDLGQASIRRLALAGPTVPAGRYAREALHTAGIWDQVKDRVLEGADVRAALAYVARGEAEAGIVYATDLGIGSAVTQALEVDARLHSPIRYPLILVRRDPIRQGARQFYDFLSSAAAAEVFRRSGFGVVR
ncbi:MAG: molybdate ABC transporter substrate-binding protein [Gemmataceae bacterium]|nr:molybdate ABC transporter substrate-binding protein [Gemmataceae bacterium]